MHHAHNYYYMILSILSILLKIRIQNKRNKTRVELITNDERDTYYQYYLTIISIGCIVEMEYIFAIHII